MRDLAGTVPASVRHTTVRLDCLGYVPNEVVDACRTLFAEKEFKFGEEKKAATLLSRMSGCPLGWV